MIKYKEKTVPQDKGKRSMKLGTKTHDHLNFLYGKKTAQKIAHVLEKILADFKKSNPHLRADTPVDHVTEKDVFLITYGDQISEEGASPLQSLTDVLNTYTKNILSGVHILPFFPYSSDDGFSVIDYTQVNPALGSWENIENLGKNFRLMFDAVINHISRQSAWFQGYLRNDPHFEKYFITIEPGTDTSQVVRPRAKPLLTPVETPEGKKSVWTTFGPDQIDLNFRDPEVFLEVIRILLLYVEKGAEIIRLDAIAYAWKKLGTSCIHLEEVHRLIKIFRLVFDLVAPNTIILTETNVPHEKNIAYFGNGFDEAQMIYQFPLPPLILHTFITGDATHLSNWAADLTTTTKKTTFFNFLASHDGIGIRPVEGILNQEETVALTERTTAHGGHVSYKTNPDGSESPYELNISYFDVLNDPHNPSPKLDVKRFLASQAIMLSLAGVPGIYFHSLFGFRNCQECVEQSGRARSINREKFERETLEKAINNKTSETARVFAGYTRLLEIRRMHPAFHPQGEQRVLFLHSKVFAILRYAPKMNETILSLINVTDQSLNLSIRNDEVEILSVSKWRDLLTGFIVHTKTEATTINIAPYQVLWLQAQSKGHVL